LEKLLKSGRNPVGIGGGVKSTAMDWSSHTLLEVKVASPKFVFSSLNLGNASLVHPCISVGTPISKSALIL